MGRGGEGRAVPLAGCRELGERVDGRVLVGLDRSLGLVDGRALLGAARVPGRLGNTARVLEPSAGGWRAPPAGDLAPVPPRTAEDGRLLSVGRPELVPGWTTRLGAVCLVGTARPDVAGAAPLRAAVGGATRRAVAGSLNSVPSDGASRTRTRGAQPLPATRAVTPYRGRFLIGAA